MTTMTKNNLKDLEQECLELCNTAGPIDLGDWCDAWGRLGGEEERVRVAKLRKFRRSLLQRWVPRVIAALLDQLDRLMAGPEVITMTIPPRPAVDVQICARRLAGGMLRVHAVAGVALDEPASVKSPAELWALIELVTGDMESEAGLLAHISPRCVVDPSLGSPHRKH